MNEWHSEWLELTVTKCLKDMFSHDLKVLLTATLRKGQETAYHRSNRF